MSDFSTRVRELPTLGMGLSTEFGVSADPAALPVFQIRHEHPEYARFLEIGVETAKGMDGTALDWIREGWPTTWHFLDINLDEPEDFDPDWLDAVRGGVALARPAWVCGDAGLWHFGPRDRGHMLLLPPILTTQYADAMAAGVRRLRAEVGLEVFPENPPGTVFLGDQHLCTFFARVAEGADTGLLLDVAHLAVYQHCTGRSWSDGLDELPWDRVVEVHVAGGSMRDYQGFSWVEDDHGGEVLPDTWRLLDVVASRATNLKAVVVECERNPREVALPLLRSVGERLAGVFR